MKPSTSNKLTKAKSSLCTFSSFWESLASTRFSILNGNSSNGKARFRTSFDTTFNRTETVRGRLKLCSRCIVFEPNETSDDSNSRMRPLIKFPYKSMTSSIQEVALYSKQDSATSEGPRMFSFTCTGYWEMLADNRIGPYQLVEFTNHGNVANVAANSTSNEKRIVLSLLHSDLSPFIKKVNQLRFICAESKESLLRIGTGRDLRLQPFIDSALQTSLQFNASNMVDFHEHLLLARPISVNRIGPLTYSPGGLMVTNKRVYFQPSQINNTGSADGRGVGIAVQFFSLSQVQRIFKRRYLLRQIALEYLLTTSQRFLFVFDSTAERDHVYSLSLAQTPNIDNCSSAMLLDLMMQRWLRREISNFEYLMFLNNEADRSCNDLTQYPVFPHIIADFKSRKLNLNSPSTFRDLSKPIGALNPERLQYFKDRFHSMSRASSAGGPPPFLYGTHYSTPGYVLHYLVRVAPEYMLCLQNGKFDAPDRMFHSLSETWESCLNNPTDLIELIPEFFTGSGEFLRNSGDLDLGFRQSSGERVSDVVLPPWADTAKDFIRKHSKALESDYVSEHLHHWIDLIFGYKQRGVEAVAADNLYYYLTYEGAVDLDAVQDSRERAALEMQIQEFGQTPKQLFSTPHPSRARVSGPDVSNSAAPSGPSSTYTGESGDGRGTKGGGPDSSSGGAASRNGGQSNNGKSSIGSFFNPHALSMSNNSAYPEVVEVFENVPASLDPNSWADARLSDMLCLDDNQYMMLVTNEDVNDMVVDIERAHDSGQETTLVSPVDTMTEPPSPPRINSSVSSKLLESGNIREIKLRLKSLRPVRNFQWHEGESLSSISIADGRVHELRVTSMDTSGVVKVHAVHLQEQVVDQHRSQQQQQQQQSDSKEKEKEKDREKENSIDRAEMVINLAPDFLEIASKKTRHCCQAVWISSDTLFVTFPAEESCLYRKVISLSNGRTRVHSGCIALGRPMTCVGVFPSPRSGGEQSATGFLVTGHENSSLQLWTIPITADEGSSNSSSCSSELLAELQWNNESENFQEDNMVKVTAVGMHQHGMLLMVVAGLADGRVLCWANGEELDGAYVSTGGFSIRFRYNASLFHRAVTCLEWTVEERCLCATTDGRLLCLDWSGNLLAAVLLDAAVQCLSAVNAARVIFAGCRDGSVRAWKLCPHREDEDYSDRQHVGLGFTSLWVWRDAHVAGSIFAISPILSEGRLAGLTSAGGDGTLVLWKF